jgi:hypothetical protein
MGQSKMIDQKYHIFGIISTSNTKFEEIEIKSVPLTTPKYITVN